MRVCARVCERQRLERFQRLEIRKAPKVGAIYSRQFHRVITTLTKDIMNPNQIDGVSCELDGLLGRLRSQEDICNWLFSSIPDSSSTKADSITSAMLYSTTLESLISSNVLPEQTCTYECYGQSSDAFVGFVEQGVRRKMAAIRCDDDLIAVVKQGERENSYLIISQYHFENQEVSTKQYILGVDSDMSQIPQSIINLEYTCVEPFVDCQFCVFRGLPRCCCSSPLARRSHQAALPPHVTLLNVWHLFKLMLSDFDSGIRRCRVSQVRNGQVQQVRDMYRHIQVIKPQAATKLSPPRAGLVKAVSPVLQQTCVRTANGPTKSSSSHKCKSHEPRYSSRSADDQVNQQQASSNSASPVLHTSAVDAVVIASGNKYVDEEDEQAASTTTKQAVVVPQMDWASPITTNNPSQTPSASHGHGFKTRYNPAVILDQEQLESFLRQIDLENQQPPFLCHLCKSSCKTIQFARKYDLKRHARVCHSTMVRKHECQVCGYKFKRLAHLQSHVNGVHNYRSHQDGNEELICSQCEGKFSCLSNLRRHQRQTQHTGDNATPPTMATIDKRK
mmetsp:Transcript_14375/g.24728  ORF Transcript_14375/g.24728 Transcript_14375/m.24728 type:complete len:561 (-) Transcript_14375:201-1883(-)